MAFSQAVHVKRMIEGVALEPKQTFWIMTINLLAESATVEWCKVFGSWDEDTHWKNAVPANQHDQVHAELLAVVGLGKNEWVAYRESIVDYRNQIVAHHDLNATVAKTPQFDVALTAAAFMFEKLRKLADPDLLGGIPTDLPRWSATVAKNMAAIVTKAFAASATLGSNIAITNAKAAE
jgi:hypothetical protein